MSFIDERLLSIQIIVTEAVLIADLQLMHALGFDLRGLHVSSALVTQLVALI